MAGADFGAQLTPAERSLRASVAANTRWANATAEDRQRQAAIAHAGLLAKFERQVDPDNQLSDEERGRRAQHLLTAHMKRLALASSRARRTKAA
jgi:hypothetical protein